VQGPQIPAVGDGVLGRPAEPFRDERVGQALQDRRQFRQVELRVVLDTPETPPRKRISAAWTPAKRFAARTVEPGASSETASR
jgi:hypothetical protein